MSERKKAAVQNIIIAVFLLLFLLATLLLSRGYSLPNSHNKKYYESNWTLTTADSGLQQTITLPHEITYRGNGKWTLSTTLHYTPEDNESPYAFINMNHMFFTVSLDGKEIYRYLPEDVPSYSYSPGNSYTMVPLPHNCYGKELRIDFWMALDGGFTYELSDVVFGDGISVLRRTFFEDLAHNLIVVSTLLIGIVLLIASCILMNSQSRKSTQSIGWFAVIFGIYNLSENLFDLYMVNNPYPGYLINFIIFASVPIPLLFFFMHKVLLKYRRVYQLIIGAAFLNVAIQTILHFTKVLDLRQALLATHVIYGAAILFSIYTLIRTPKKEFPQKTIMLMGTVPIAVGMAIDSFLHYFPIVPHQRNTAFIFLGVFIFLIIQAVVCIHDITEAFRDSTKSAVYKSLAYQDGLTGLQNRTSYSNELENIRLNPQKYKKCICVYVDMNNLKSVNDRLGHQAGDEFIRSTAHLLQRHLGPYGKVFRFGGDEFIALLDNMSESKFRNILCQMNEEINSYNRTAPVKIDFSLGCHQWRAGESIEDCIDAADRNMYENKLCRSDPKNKFVP
ncbi:GGDEF domain-containing protein [Fumia xinanensis]|uniref:Diguanylate cyclase n=1 Tax=Fumia xinanensis TaxID=2763659 RepID=A0A926E1Y3_9FIRM|nr:GGDEF domain-containing protein [Fumia xinanensis]MBC8559512.1 diguanylate cyclase [Fumia xinanensis]